MANVVAYASKKEPFYRAHPTFSNYDYIVFSFVCYFDNCFGGIPELQFLVNVYTLNPSSCI